MEAKTFKGGVHLEYNKEMAGIEELEAPKLMIFPLRPRSGMQSTPVVAEGDTVKVGQLIGKGDVNLHSSVSGKVTAIKPCVHPDGEMSEAVYIENDGTYEIHSSVKPGNDITRLTAEQIREIVQNAGIIGMGGGAFPTHIKLTQPRENIVATVMINAAECEPYLTCDHAVMMEQGEDVVYGLLAAMKALEVSEGCIVIETNKPDAIQRMEELVKDIQGLSVVAVKTKYPQGSEKQLIDAVTGKKVPPGGLPSSVGVIVLNVGTAAAIAKAIKKGMPLIKRVVTVAGDAVKNRKNYTVRIGTPIKDVIEAAGGFSADPAKVILGGVMMGYSVDNLDVPMIKNTGAVLCLSSEKVNTEKEINCMRCGKCASVCPVNLMPFLLSAYYKKANTGMLEKLYAEDCIECGGCTYICPSRKSLVQDIRAGKAMLKNGRKVVI